LTDIYNMISILTGDIIDSHQAKNPSEFITPLKSFLSGLGKTPSDWELFRGDAFQVKINDPLKAVEKAIQLRAELKKTSSTDARIAIGIGTESYLASNITESNGEAYKNSGNAFDIFLKKENTLAIKSPWPDFNRSMNLILQLSLLFINQWSQKSAELVTLLMENPSLTQEEMAAMLHITQSSVSERYNRAKIALLTQVIEEYKIQLSKFLKEVK